MNQPLGSRTNLVSSTPAPLTELQLELELTHPVLGSREALLKQNRSTIDRSLFVLLTKKFKQIAIGILGTGVGFALGVEVSLELSHSISGGEVVIGWNRVHGEALCESVTVVL